MNTVARIAPPPLEHPLPPCSLCGEDVEYDDGAFYCIPCGCSWDGNLSHLDGYSSWDNPDLPQCPAKVMPWKGSIRYPHAAKLVEYCRLSKGHDPARHRSGEHDWTDEDLDSHALEPDERAQIARKAADIPLAAETPDGGPGAAVRA